MYVSAHGFGHAVRAAAVLSALQQIHPLRITVLAACDRRIWPESLLACTQEWILQPCDAGVVQRDDVTVDMAATEKCLTKWLRELPAITEREATRLRGCFDLVLGDVPSPAFEAAKLAQVQSVAVANFSWDWIYGELGFGQAAAAAARAYAHASLLIEASPYGPMPAFSKRCSVGLVARAPSSRREDTRAVLDVSPEQSLMLLAFQPASAPALFLPPPRPGRVYVAPRGFPGLGLRGDLRYLPDAVTFPDALAAADVVLGKPGYGLIGDVGASGCRFLYVPRPGFPENEVLESYLSSRPGTSPLSPANLASGQWEDQLVALEEKQRPERADAGGATRAANAIAAFVGPTPERGQ